MESALRGNATNYRYNLTEGETDFEATMQTYHDRLLSLLKRVQGEKGAIKWYFASRIRFVKANDEKIFTVGWFRSKNVVSLNSHGFKEALQNAYIESLHACAQFQKLGSNWVIDQIETLDLNVVVYKPLEGSSYIELPPYIKNKKAVINIKNEDNLCFAYSVLTRILPKTDAG